MDSPEIEVDIERLGSDVINEHLRTSKSFLHDIMSQDLEDSDTESSAKTVSKRKEIKRNIVPENSQGTCKHCGKIFTNLTTLYAHMLLKHSDEGLSKCGQCDKTYPSQLSLDKHFRNMHLGLHCAVCYRTFDNTQLLSEHSNVCKKMEVVCCICKNVFGSVVSLRNHVKYMHPIKRGDWTCACGQRFPSRARLQSHVLYRHTNSHKCRHCHKAFASAARLARHVNRQHSD